MVSVEKPIVVELESSDGIVFVVQKEIACESLYLKSILETMNVEDPEDVHLTVDVDGNSLKKALDYCFHYCGVPYTEEYEPPTWDKEFIKGIEMESMGRLLEVANKLEIEGLVNLTAWKIGKRLEHLAFEELRMNYGGKDFLLPEEEVTKLHEKWGWITEHH